MKWKMTIKIPNISLGEYGYEGTITLDAWRGFLTKKNGAFGLYFGGDMVIDNPTIEDEHIAAYRYIVDNQYAIRDAVLEALLKNYKDLQEHYGYEDEEAEQYMPDVNEMGDFKKLIGLINVHVMNVYKNGMAYFGLEFDCTWDEEHGFGVMMYKDNVVELGGANKSILTWVAERAKNEIGNNLD
ncbi:DUF6985 domain-containing protein [Paenibacillus sp. Soil724D2]|uniref:DUF6985 domain-containing protein n=1 Tax=Paenibacillus sp. (strain Soil724D2) TaxID=1736392 RepID=UPI000AE697E5|nr:hypothetical protein [Paenibacillus sp. Soil724D2]